MDAESVAHDSATLWHKSNERQRHSKQFKVIETLMAAADEVINCGDAGQEGELIQRWVMQKHCANVR